MHWRPRAILITVAVVASLLLSTYTSEASEHPNIASPSQSAVTIGAANRAIENAARYAAWEHAIWNRAVGAYWTSVAHARTAPQHGVTHAAVYYAAGTCGGIPRSINDREAPGCNYGARNPKSTAGGVCQMVQGTADHVAVGIGHPELVGVNAADWPPPIQDKGCAWLWNQPGGPCNWKPNPWC